MASLRSISITGRILGGSGSRTIKDYVELSLGDFDTARGDVGLSVHVAEIGGQQDVIAIKDTVYDGDLVITDITRHTTSDSMMEYIIDDLRQTAREVNDDIVRRGDDQIAIIPTGIFVLRQKLDD